MGNRRRGLRARLQLEDGWSHLHEQINREEQLGREADCTTQGPSVGK